LLDEADAVIHFNGKRFDIPTLNKDFLLNGIRPPAPYKHIDLLTTVRTQFRFTSNKLDHVCEQLGLGNKTKHAGAELWIKCMAGDKAAWSEMEEYNIRDVEMTEALYLHLLPWIKSHPNYSVMTGECVCPNCGSAKHQKRGFAFSLAGKYQRYQCRECGTWYRGVKNMADRSKFVTNGV
jgi:DNA polymerase III epsilon subunit-like protein